MNTWCWVPGVLALVPVAQGQIVYVSQSRLVSAHTNAGTNSDSTVDLGPWRATAASTIPGFAWANAAQSTDLRADVIRFDVSGSAANINANPADSFSSLDVTFTIGEPTEFELIMGNTDIQDTGRLRLTMGTTQIFGYISSQGPLSRSGGLLGAGTYQFTVSAAGYSTAGHDGGGAVVGALFIPAPSAVGMVLAGCVVGEGRRRRR
jgi:hypothetical protein